jgi:hypothetical protein
MTTITGFDSATGIWHMPTGRQFDLTKLIVVRYSEESGFEFEFEDGTKQYADTFSGGEIIQSWLAGIFIKGRDKNGKESIC